VTRSARAEAGRVAASAARRDTMTAALLTVAGNLLGLGISVGLIGWTDVELLRLAHAAIGAMVFLHLRHRHGLTSVRRSVVAYLVVVLPLVVLLPFMVDIRAAIDGGENMLFMTFFVVIMGVALLTPASVALGAALVILFTAEAIALWLATTGEYPMARTIGAWGMALFGAIAIGLVFHRAHQRSLAERLIHVEVELGTLARLSQLSLEVRDQVNTPLQTLQLGFHALRHRAPEHGPLLDRMERALARLTQLSRKLSRS
jgi:hypothetical protein